MKDEIKKLFPIEFYIKKDEMYAEVSLENLNKIVDHITNLQEIAEEHKNCTRKHWQQKCAEHYANEMIYKSRNEKAIGYMQDNNLSNFDKDLYYILIGGDEE